MTFDSLFAGIGGFDLGFERAGMRCEWQVENNPHRLRVLEKRFPNARRHDDIRTFHPQPRPGRRILCGGFPCKQTSTAAAITGNRAGLEGVDSGLWYEMLRVVRVGEYDGVVVENVSGAATWSGEIKGGLEAAGYVVPKRPLRLSAKAFGAPHRRWRVFWIAHRHGSGLAFPWATGSPAIECVQGRAIDRNPWLSSLAGVVRVDDGLPGGVDRRQRIESCGNALMPAMAEWIGRRIMNSPHDDCYQSLFPRL